MDARREAITSIRLPENPRLAVVDRAGGYALDAYPGELDRYRRQLGAQIVGEFDTSQAALERVRQCLTN